MNPALARLADPQPVGQPGLAVMALGFVVFLVALAVARGEQGAAAERGSRSARASIAGVLIQMIAFMAVGLGPIVPGLAAGAPLAIGEALAIGALMAACIALFAAAARAMGKNWSIVARTRSDHQLVTSGPFAVIRHPIYTGLFAFMLALALAFGHWRALILGVPLYWIGTWIRVIREEKLLRAQFGEAYDAYARRVRRFVPGVI